MSNSQRGYSFVSGSADDGRLTLLRADGKQYSLPVILCLGTVTDVTGDGVLDINFPGGS